MNSFMHTLCPGFNLRKRLTYELYQPCLVVYILWLTLYMLWLYLSLNLPAGASVFNQLNIIHDYLTH